MADMKKGFIPLWRDLANHWLWKSEEPFDNRSAWVDLLMMVNHEEAKIQVGMKLVTIHPGEKWTSIRQLSERWHWSKNRVKRFINLLESDYMITVKTTTNGTLLTIVNYDNFRLSRDTNEHTNGYTNGYTSGYANGYASGHQTIMNNNDIDNEKEGKKKTAPPPSFIPRVYED